MFDCLSPADAAAMARDCLAHGILRPTVHFRERLEQRGLTLDHALHVIKVGAVQRPGEYDVKRGCWRYAMQGHSQDGDRLTVVFSLHRVRTMVLITVWAIED